MGHLALGLLLALAPAQTPAWTWCKTEDLGRLTPPPALASVGLVGTDLGVSFPSGERLVFLFGDSWTQDGRDRNHDSTAWTKRAPLGVGPPALTWTTRADGRFATLAPRDRPQLGMDVPVEGVEVDGRTYVFFSSGWDRRAARHSHSVLAHAEADDLSALELDHRVATEKFVNVSLVVDGDVVWIFGSGAYRKSAVFLARADRDALADRSAWRYWPEFVPDESRARPIVHSDCVGELSVRRIPGADLLAMTYNAKLPRGIHLRMAADPTGPWSDPVVVFDPSRDGGYGVTMHQRCSAVGFDDGLSMPGREEEWAGEYGPYLVPEWCSSPAPGVLELVYTLSTWNPYTVRLVRSTVAAPDARWSPPPSKPPSKASGRRPVNLDFADGKLRGWTQEGDAFATVAHDDDTTAVLTYVAPKGDAVQGRLWQDLTLSSSVRELRGVVTGGSEELQLWRGDELVYRTSGRRSNEVDVPFRWRLDALRGETVRLVISDASSARWGFVNVRGLELVD